MFDVLLDVCSLADEAKRTRFRLFPGAGAGHGCRKVSETCRITEQVLRLARVCPR